MIINLIAVGKNMPGWINIGFMEYTKRLPQEYKLNLVEVPIIKRGKTSNLEQIKQKEAEAIFSAIPKNSLVIALDEHGQQWNTNELSNQLQKWRENWQQVSLIIGGPDGLAPICLEKANVKWSLSPLTLPHQMVRIIIAEQIYRAWSILAKHPYHRD